MECDNSKPKIHDDEHLKLTFRNLYNDTLNLDWSKVKWDMVFSLVSFHIVAAYGLYLWMTLQVTWQSQIFFFACAICAGLGITMGNHRLWTHRTFEACFLVRFVLMLFNAMAFQESIYLWCQNHRVHHKWSDTDSDFTNSRRGFFFAHMGWKMYQTHDDVITSRKKIDCSDLMADPIVRYQHQYYYWISLPMCFILPTLLPCYAWNEDVWIAFAYCTCLRLALTFHVTWLVNSYAHIHGYQPYDENLHAFESSLLGTVALGEGWHNFHHAFPRDYRASELNSWGKNVTTGVIEALASLGLVWDLKTVSEEHILRRIERTGDISLRRLLG